MSSPVINIHQITLGFSAGARTCILGEKLQRAVSKYSEVSLADKKQVVAQKLVRRFGSMQKAGTSGE